MVKSLLTKSNLSDSQNKAISQFLNDTILKIDTN